MPVASPSMPRPRPTAGRLGQVIREEFSTFHLPIAVSGAIIGLIPDYYFARARTHLMRLAGWQVGDRSIVYGLPRFTGTGQLRHLLMIGSDCHINVGCFFELNDRVDLATSVFIGHEVMFLTSTHKLGGSSRRAGEHTFGPIVVGEGAWIGARSTILPGVTIGAGAVVAAGTIVNKDVAPNTLVSGVPAEVIVKRLPG